MVQELGKPVLAASRLDVGREDGNQGSLRRPDRCACDLGTPFRLPSEGTEEAERFEREDFLFHSSSRGEDARGAIVGQTSFDVAGAGTGTDKRFRERFP